MTDVQITKQRVNGRYSAKYLSDNGSYRHSANNLCLEFPEHFKGAIQAASIWKVSGPKILNVFEVNGITYKEDLIQVDAAEMVRPSTRLLEAWLVKNIKTVGQVKAGKFVRNTYFEDYARDADIQGLLTIPGMSQAVAKEIVRKYPKPETVEAINWFSMKRLPVKVALKICDVMQSDAIEAVTQNPFILAKFGVEFSKCLNLAYDLGFQDSDTVVQAARAVEVVRKHCASTGSTIAPREAFEGLVGNDPKNSPDALLRAAGELGELAPINGGYAREGTFVVEYETAARLKAALNREDGAGSELAGWEKAVAKREIKYYLDKFEQTIPFNLVDGQRKAIIGAVKSKVCLLSGGAGTGKTTILKAILTIMEKVSLGIEVVQLALSGRAARRMAEATGRPAHTIAKFVTDMKNKKPNARPQHCIVVIDEASMVDVYSMHTLTKYLHPATRYIFVGDDQQLPPVGGGLVFHSLLEGDYFPRFHLEQVQRQHEESGIHTFATGLRNNLLTPLPSYVANPQADCSLFPSDDAVAIKELVGELGHETMVLCATQKGRGGVREINKVMQQAHGFDRPAICYFDEEQGLVDYISEKGNKFFIDDPILITKNAYDIDVRNGDIGRIIEVYFEPNEQNSSGIIELNGRYLQITPDLLEKMDLAYAITIHKSQGSQWRNTVVVVNKSGERMLDKTLLYTAVTRATDKCLIASPDQSLLVKAVERGSLALNRKVAISEFIKN